MTPAFADPAQASLPVHLVAAPDLAAFLEGVGAPWAGWPRATGFEAGLGEVRLLPGADGTLAGAVAGHGTAQAWRPRSTPSGARSWRASSALSSATALPAQSIRSTERPARCPEPTGSASRQSRPTGRSDIGRQRLRVAGAKRVDVQAAPARVAGIHGQFVWLAALADVHEHTLHTVLMKAVVVAKTDDVAQQAYAACMRGDAICVPGVLNRAAMIASRAKMAA